MLRLSQSVGYAIQALARFEEFGEGTNKIREVAVASGVPAAYLAKLVARLGEAGILESKRGIGGGTRLSRPANEITLLEIVKAIEGEQARQCLIGLSECHDEQACPVHAYWVKRSEEIRRVLATTRLSDVIAHERLKAARGGARKRVRQAGLKTSGREAT